MSDMDFAPYQNTAPEGDRPASPRSRSLSPKRSSRESPALPDPNEFGDDRYGLPGPDYNAGSLEAGGLNVNLFETSLIRLDYEAMLAYLLLPPAGAVLLLIVEHRNDYVRYVGALHLCYFTGDGPAAEGRTKQGLSADI